MTKMIPLSIAVGQRSLNIWYWLLLEMVTAIKTYLVGTCIQNQQPDSSYFHKFYIKN